VQVERFWKIESVLLLGWGLMMSVLCGAVGAHALRRFGPELSIGDERFYTFLVGAVSFQGVGLILIHFFLRDHQLTWPDFLGFTGPRLGRSISLAFAIVVVALPLIVIFNELMRILITRLHEAPDMQPTMQALEISVSLGQRICFGFTAIVLAPIVEEILFRGILYRTIQQRGFPKLALFGSALLFGIIHGSVMTLLPLTALAIVLALLYERTQNLMAPIFAHSVFNAVNFFGYIYREDLTQWWKQL
jgi:membrane protease YdiL (CAAX protease family)